jgi:hypothetical protein
MNYSTEIGAIYDIGWTSDGKRTNYHLIHRQLRFRATTFTHAAEPGRHLFKRALASVSNISGCRSLSSFSRRDRSKFDSFHLTPFILVAKWISKFVVNEMPLISFFLTKVGIWIQLSGLDPIARIALQLQFAPSCTNRPGSLIHSFPTSGGTHYERGKIPKPSIRVPNGHPFELNSTLPHRTNDNDEV